MRILKSLVEKIVAFFYDEVEHVAKVAHEVNRAFCKAQGDNSQPAWEDAPEWQKLSAIEGVKAIIEDPSMTPQKSHEGWMTQKYKDGWKYGPVKDPENKEHPCMVPYEELPESQRAKDELFVASVKAALGWKV